VTYEEISPVAPALSGWAYGKLRSVSWPTYQAAKESNADQNCAR
jgi:hypothetical protein